MEGPPASQAPGRLPVEVDRSGDILVRAPGCLVAFVAFVLLLSLPDILDLVLPSLLIASIGVTLGLGLLALYVRSIRQRWGVTPGDVVQLLAYDLDSVRRRSLTDYRLHFGRGWRLQERLLHEALYVLKWVGHLLVFAGLGSILYRLFVALGIVR